MQLCTTISRCVARAYEKAHGHPIERVTLITAVNYPKDTHRADELGEALCVIFTEYSGLSQYGNDRFWQELSVELKWHALYYEWVDGGTATVWPIV